jgi:hypothetical protein
VCVHGSSGSGAKLPNRQGEAVLEATPTHATIRNQGYRLRVSDVHHFFGFTPPSSRKKAIIQHVCME